MEGYSIGEVAAEVGMSIDALRFYEREGLLVGPIDRTAGGRRRYGRADVEWLGICSRLRETRMPLSELRRFAELVRAGPGNESDRLALLEAHRDRIGAQMSALEDALAIITWKTETYERRLRSGEAGGVWDPTVPSD